MGDFDVCSQFGHLEHTESVVQPSQSAFICRLGLLFLLRRNKQMNKVQKVLVNLLSSAIRGKEPEIIENENIDWRAVYEEAKLHDVHPLLYKAVSSIKGVHAPASELMSEWQRSTLLAGTNQIQHIYQASKTLNIFNNAGIPVIGLKGLVLRDLYPSPELRTMGDADILVHKKDLEFVKAMLEALSYHDDGCSAKHIHFSHDNYPTIEVHWTLVDSSKFKRAEWFDKAVWKNAEAYTISHTPALVLSKEDELLHVCLHMAGHLMSSGFGLRQLCDLVLLIEDKNRLVNWTSLIENIKACGLESFFSALLAISKKLLNLETPKALQPKASELANPIEELIYDILDGGVFGKTSVDRTSGNLLLHYTRGEKQGSIIKVYLSLIFPSPEKLANKYAYARKYKLLLPLAWVHRLIYIIFRKDYSLSNKKIFLSSNKLLPVLERRAKLLEHLELQ
jgi:hypothetical protein